jgi:hypothetical protein
MLLAHHINKVPDPVFRTLDELRTEMTCINHKGAEFLDYLLAGDYFEGKGVWVNGRDEVRAFYDEMLSAAPHLVSESPYGEWFRTKMVRTQGENQILLRHVGNAPSGHQEVMKEHVRLRSEGSVPSACVFAGGPAAKIAAVIAASGRGEHNVSYLLDGAEQSNESGSASYEHVNHANGLAAEHDNTGLGILFSALSRALKGEPNPAVALDYDYRKIDLWPRAVKIRDLPIYAGNEFHGWLQRLKTLMGVQNDHTKSRLASKASTQILTFLEELHDCSLRIDNTVKRAIFLYFTEKQYAISRKDNEDLRSNVGLRPETLTANQLASFYGSEFPSRVLAGDIFPENACIRHGFDGVCRRLLQSLGARDLHRYRITEIYLDNHPSEPGRMVVRGLAAEDLARGDVKCIPVDHLGLSLGPTATFHYATNRGGDVGANRLFRGCRPVPYQTIATGMSAQVRFRITDPKRVAVLPFTGMKQTHFVEIGRSSSHVLMKLTCGGMIGLPIYSRSYGISAIASMLRVITPGMGLRFEDVICAWPCTRGVNPTNNGQVVRIAENAAVRFGEGGTGMSKMGTNAQTLLDLAGVPWVLPEALRLNESLYRHTVIDNRHKIYRQLSDTR